MRRLYASTLLVALALPWLGQARHAAPAHDCTDHVCFCRSAAAAKPCHGATIPDAPRMEGACNHGDPSLAPASQPWVLADIAPPWPGHAVRRLEPAPGRAPEQPLLVPDPPPPRAA